MGGCGCGYVCMVGGWVGGCGRVGVGVSVGVSLCIFHSTSAPHWYSPLPCCPRTWGKVLDVVGEAVGPEVAKRIRTCKTGFQGER